MCRLSWNLGASTSRNPQGLSRPVMGLLFLITGINYAVDKPSFSKLSKSPISRYQLYRYIHYWRSQVWGIQPSAMRRCRCVRWRQKVRREVLPLPSRLSCRRWHFLDCLTLKMKAYSLSKRSERQSHILEEWTKLCSVCYLHAAPTIVGWDGCDRQQTIWWKNIKQKHYYGYLLLVGKIIFKVDLNTVSEFKYINQLDATISPVYYLTFICSSTCFGRPHAHHQELNNCSSSLWFYFRSVAITVLLAVIGPAGRPDHDQQHCYHHAPTVKPETATAVVELLMMGVRTPETCWAVNKRQVINCRNCCI